MIKFEHIRHATSIIEVNGKRIIIDPVFADKGTYPPIVNTKNKKRNPIVDLPFNIMENLNFDGIIITHNHNDHFDLTAKETLNKNLPILCQIEDKKIIEDLGFRNVTGLELSENWLGFKISRFRGYHGGHIFKNKLGVSSAYFFESTKENFFLTGDTLLTTKMRMILKRLKPSTIIANGGGARMKILGALTMNNKDIIRLCKNNNTSKIIAVHMDSINHCYDTRDMLKKKVLNKIDNILIPQDGETILIV